MFQDIDTSHQEVEVMVIRIEAVDMSDGASFNIDVSFEQPNHHTNLPSAPTAMWRGGTIA